MVQDADLDMVPDDGSGEDQDDQGTMDDEGSGGQGETILADLKAQVAKAQQELKDARAQVSGVQKAETRLRAEKEQLQAMLQAMGEAGQLEYEDPEEMRQGLQDAAQQAAARAPILAGATEGLKYRYIAKKIREELDGNWALMPGLEQANTWQQVDAMVNDIKSKSQPDKTKLLAEVAALRKEIADLQEGTHETQPFIGGVRTVTGGANALDALNDQFNAGTISRAEFEKRATALMRKL